MICCTNLVAQPILIHLEFTCERNTEVCDLELMGFFVKVTSLFKTYHYPVIHTGFERKMFMPCATNEQVKTGSTASHCRLNSPPNAKTLLF